MSDQLVQELGAKIAPIIAGQPVLQTAAALAAVLATILGSQADREQILSSLTASIRKTWV